MTEEQIALVKIVVALGLIFMALAGLLGGLAIGWSLWG